MVHQSTIPWSVLDSSKEEKTRAREIQVAPWSVKMVESSTSRVWCRGELGVPLQENMASTLVSVT